MGIFWNRCVHPRCRDANHREVRKDLNQEMQVCKVTLANLHAALEQERNDLQIQRTKLAEKKAEERKAAEAQQEAERATEALQAVTTQMEKVTGLVIDTADVDEIIDDVEQVALAGPSTQRQRKRRKGKARANAHANAEAEAEPDVDALIRQLRERDLSELQSELDARYPHIQAIGDAQNPQTYPRLKNKWSGFIENALVALGYPVETAILEGRYGGNLLGYLYRERHRFSLASLMESLRG
jgi:hypothetical protein